MLQSDALPTQYYFPFVLLSIKPVLLSEGVSPSGLFHIYPILASASWSTQNDTVNKGQC